MIAHIRNICNNKKFSYQTLEFRPPLNIKYNYTFTTFFDKSHLGPTILSFSKIHKHIISILGSHPSYREELCQFDTIPLGPFSQTTTVVPAIDYP